MRIFYAAGSRPNASLPASSVWRRNLYKGLTGLGHDVVEFDFDLDPYYGHADPRDPAQADFVAGNRPRLEAALLAQVTCACEEAPVDVFFSYFYSSFARPEVITAIHDLGITTVNWYCNASYQFHLVREIAPAYDYCLVPERYRLDDYRAAGATPLYCQEAANPAFYRPYDRTHEYGVTFVGACYGERPYYVRHLLDHKVDVHVFGPGWSVLTPSRPAERLRRRLGRAKCRLLGRPAGAPLLPPRVWGGMLTDDEMVRMYSRSCISLGFSVVGETHVAGEPIRQVRLRDFEAPMSGAFYLLEYLPDIEECFVPGREIVCFRSRRELADLARHYLAHPEEAERIARAGRERALRDHTWQKRLSDAFAEMGLGS